jgi:hypothetical protein
MAGRSRNPGGVRALARSAAWLGLAAILLVPACRAVLFPETVGGWKALGAAERFNRETIFSYMNGAAEVYLMHGFRVLQVRRYAKPDGPQVVIEVFDMGSPEGAYGAFSHSGDLEGQEVAVGQGGHYLSGLLSFWKGRYLVCLSVRDGAPVPLQEIRPIAAAVAAAIRSAGRRPDLAQRLPSRGLRQRTVRYFRSPAALGYHYDPLGKLPGFDGSGEAVLAEYRRASATSLLLLLRFSDAPRAVQAREAVLRRLLGPSALAGSPAPGRRPDGKWTAASAAGRMLAAVLEAPTESEARELLAEAISSLGGEER